MRFMASQKGESIRQSTETNTVADLAKPAKDEED